MQEGECILKVLGPIAEAGPRQKSWLFMEVPPSLPWVYRPCSPVIGTVRGCHRGIGGVGNQPLEGRARAQADGRPVRRGHVAAAGVEIAHQHDVLPGDTAGWPRDRTGAPGAPSTCVLGAHLHVPLLPDILVDVVERVDLMHCIQRGRVQGHDGKLLDLCREGCAKPGGGGWGAGLG